MTNRLSISENGEAETMRQPLR